MSPKVIDETTLHAREEEIMQTALEIISELGVAGLTIDKVVARLPYSKGTIYNHFTCKEDLLTGLCNRSVENVAALFERAITYDGSSREKMLAVGYAYMLHSQLNPTEFMLVISAKTPSVREKSTEKRQEEHLELENRLLGGLLKVISSGLASGELNLLPHLSPAQVAFSLWSMSFGTIALLHESLDRCSVRVEMQLERELINHSNILLDGLNWQPFTQDHNWQETIERFKKELFADEVQQLRAQSAPT
ncbi:TetR/AcrR family transcriptional regulator [uncultured Neptuniibacter sp.]|uniref:TetR/AcrR family transcriptional regulator n=1 Tax=uncultured Neptuniibacter sp. TaxID=502143 RepID=UPI0026232A93|nr:TetR/AcrR family transcriptional regulator [uncultured Neptuniibacter sp.]